MAAMAVPAESVIVTGNVNTHDESNGRAALGVMVYAVVFVVGDTAIVWDVPPQASVALERVDPSIVVENVTVSAPEDDAAPETPVVPVVAMVAALVEPDALKVVPVTELTVGAAGVELELPPQEDHSTTAAIAAHTPTTIIAFWIFIFPPKLKLFRGAS